MRNRLRLVGVVLVVTAIAGACGSSTTRHSTPPGPARDPAGVKLIGSAHEVPLPNAAALRAAAASEAQFAVALYGELASAKDDVAIAPSSIATVLGMIAAGAHGATEAQLDGALRVALPAAERDAGIGGLARSFANRTRRGVTLGEVDQAWLQKGRSVLTPYADTLAGAYDAPLATIDFDHAAAAAATINRWFGEHTHGKIKQLIDAGDLDPSTALVLTDAVYLDAKWAHGFDPKRTASDPFHLANGTVANVPTMHMSSEDFEKGPSLGYAAGDGWNAVSLPYVGNELEMDVIVPDDLASFEAQLSAQLPGALAALRPAHVVVSMPRFDTRVQTDLVEPLQKLGIHDAFDANAADFSGIDGQHDLYVSDVMHEVVVHVDESGTVAAGATAGIMRQSAAPIMQTVNVDKPFVYAVRDRTTGAILFLGSITDPR
jgi:serpin B